MATGRVRAGFFHTRTQPTDLPWKPGPDPWVCPRNPDPVHLLNRFFSQSQTRPVRPPQALSPHAQPSPNRKHKFWFMIFRPKITNTDTNLNTIININSKIRNTNARSMIFPFKITNQTQILDLWFSLSKSQTLTHMIENLRRTEPKKKKKKGERGGMRSATTRMKRSYACAWLLVGLWPCEWESWEMKREKRPYETVSERAKTAWDNGER